MNVYSPKKMLTASKAVKTKTFAFIDDIKAGGGTNIYDALLTAFDFGGKGGSDRKKLLSKSVDTVFFLSDGVPTAGKLVNTDQILRDIALRNKTRNIIIHAVGLTTETDKEEEKSKLADFVKKLAEENGGNYAQK